VKCKVCLDYTLAMSAPGFKFTLLPVDRTLQNVQQQPKRENSYSVIKASASIYLFGCCFYNACFCCFSGYCGKSFCFPGLICFEVKLGRDRWLWYLHFLCFCIHLGWAIAAYTAGMESDMLVEIYRIKPSWEDRGGGYGYEIVPAKHQFLHIHVVTALFFGFSALMHGIWVFFSPWSWSKRLLWNQLDDCICVWRWFEYSFSASLMFVGIAVTTAIRDQNTLVAITFLSFSTMWCGYFTELVSRPALNADGTYNREMWAGDPSPPIKPPENATKDQQDIYNRELNSYTWARVKNYARRMLPHFLGCFPYTAAWWIILTNFFEQIDDLCQGLKDRMPAFVPWIIYGSAAIFSLFTCVQWRYARTPCHISTHFTFTTTRLLLHTRHAGTNGPLQNTIGVRKCGTASCRCAAHPMPSLDIVLPNLLCAGHEQGISWLTLVHQCDCQGFFQRGSVASRRRW